MRAGRERTFQVPCTVNIEHSAESLHAHVALEGFEAGPGDVVVVHGAPTIIPFGEQRTFHCHATVTRASALGRLRAKLEGYLELTELYEVGFSDWRAS